MAFYGSDLSIDEGGLAVYGENVARLMRLNGKTRSSGIASCTKKELAELQKRHGELLAIYGGARNTPAVAEWLLDNYFLARGEALKAIDELRAPIKLSSEKGLPALFWLCTCLVRSGEGRVTIERCRLFFTGCQNIYVLNSHEISLLVSVLRAALISELAALYTEGTLTEEAAAFAEKLFTSLRLVSTLDFSGLLEDIDRIEQLYRQDPAGVYPQMNERTRAHYKKRTAELAKRRHISELRFAERVLYNSRTARGEDRHIGHWLYTSPYGHKRRHRHGARYIIAYVFFTLFVSLLLAAALSAPWASLLLLLPVSEIIKFLLDTIILGILPPSHVPRMELEGGVPLEGRTICVISALLTNEKNGPVLARKLEEYSLANRSAGKNLLFGILGDLPDAQEAVSGGDEAIISSVRRAVDELNSKYGGGFFLLLRDREYNKQDKKYMAYERKRGAVTELARLLEGKSNSMKCLSGSALSLRGVRYILTLDEDTRLTPDSALSFIGAMLHPLNRPVVDKKSCRVISGHAVIQPRMSTELSSVTRSDFSRVFAGLGGSDPYGCDCSELYMDAFQSGGFAGKGIIDVHAFYTCLEGRIPENTVLSHDALEGAYLRGALMSDTELLDSYPSDILSYYKRMHRWTRGDWQNSPWLLRRGKVLSQIDRFRLFDSLRRSLFIPGCFLAFILAFFVPGAGLSAAAAVALLALCLRLIQSGCQNLFREEALVRLRFRSRPIRGFNESLMQTMIRLLLMPYETFVSLTAIFTALWRMLVSHKNMLNWTPASVFDGRGQSLVKYYGYMWFAPLLGLCLVIFAPSIIGKSAGIVWMLSPAMALSISRPKTAGGSGLSDEDTRYLLSCAAKIWTFFEELCTPVDHFLPPDNFQERPPVGVAHRSSPTNIGLCLVSALAAIDLGIARGNSALGIIENILATMRRMPKWNGHLYNWYDTQTLKPLHPAYVSTVDSGNLAVCLMTLREGLLEIGEIALAEQCAELIGGMSFKPLYDKKRRLFSIGVDTEKGGLSGSYYDLMASEARTASFIAIARGEVPRRHWQSLSRAQVQSGRRRGCVSWTGTMFEYLMPRLFFKSLRGSLIYEADHFCVHVQRSRCKKQGLPWGISESAYYSLDSSLNYRYKAHGCGALALKRGMDQELVISPYSSFLALCCDKNAAVKNLRVLEKIAPQGKYGFWDAIDYTPGRADGSQGEIVRCAMAHHLGMSLVAIANCICGEVMPRRLMRIPEMSAYSCLLEEKLPLSGGVLRRRESKTPEKPPRASSVFWEKRGNFTDWYSPECCTLSNGSYNIMLTDSGSSHVSWNGLIPYYTPCETPSVTHGFDMWLEQEDGLVPILPSPKLGKNVETAWEFSLASAKITTQHQGFRAQTVFSVSSECNGEKRRVSVSPKDKTQSSARLFLGLRPVLAPLNDYVNHPAFYGLGLSAYEVDGCLMLRRLKRGKNPECYMCLAASAPMSFSARRDLLPGRGNFPADYKNAFPSPLGDLNDPYICAGVELRLAEGNENAVTLALAVGYSEREAFDSAQRILMEPDSRAADFPLSYAKSLGLNEKQLEMALDLLKTTAFPKPRIYEPPMRELWRFGVSGDLPVITQSVNSQEDLEDAASLMLCHNLLAAIRRPFDLVFITDEGGDYMRPLAVSLENLRRSAGAGSGNIHVVDRSLDVEALQSIHCEARERPIDGRNVKYVMSTISAPSPASHPETHWNDDNSFYFYVNHSLPPRAWSNMLTNGHFGYLATDCNTGHMWFENAREYHINRWLNDPQAASGTENLTFGGSSVFASPEDSCGVTFGFGFARWEKELSGLAVKTEAFVPADVNARVLIITWEGGPMDISWYTDLVLGGDPTTGRAISIIIEENLICAESADSPFPDYPFKICANTPYKALVTEREKWLRSGERPESSGVDSIGLEFRAESPFILVCGCDDSDKLVSLTKEQSALDSLRRTKKGWAKAVSKVKIETPLPSLDRLVNGWLPYQTLACRLMGRCSVYQSGGAVGFRDQLQDAVNLILLNSALARDQILLCCRRQYEEGDVMHWWHTLQETTRGVRTRCSDDLLWLPWALCEYVEKTGDAAICDVPVPWLTSPELKDGEDDRYEQAVFSTSSGSVMDHCEKALDCIIRRGTGAHGLLKIGGGDWNDGMDRVGCGGHGESVWLSWFFSHTVHRFAALLRVQGSEETAIALERAAKTIGEKANEAWDGQWYLRGWFDDGAPLGSAAQDCCRIDSIAQSFAALSPEADKARVSEALSSAVGLLFDRENKIVKLFDPPFAASNPNPGYIESYGPGFRENGGQYTHGAIWLAMALLGENRAGEAMELIQALIPSEHNGEIYKAEPYVLAADVSSNPAAPGLAGWSWYTGAAGWLWRVITEDMLGIKPENGEVRVSPKLPPQWRDKSVRVEIDGKPLALPDES